MTKSIWQHVRFLFVYFYLFIYLFDFFCLFGFFLLFFFVFFFFFFLLITFRSNLLVGIKWCFFQKIYESQFLLSAHTIWQFKIPSFAQFPVDHISYPIMPSLTLFCAGLLHSLTIWLIVSYISQHNLHLLFDCIIIFIPRLFSVYAQSAGIVEYIDYISAHG